jgi:hypothetical protein
MPNCLKCDKPLKAIGTARKNGKSHPDWATREYHKCCWKELKDQEANERYMNFFRMVNGN